MKQKLLMTIAAAACTAFSISANAQLRYAEEIFDESEIDVQTNVTYGINVDFIKNTSLLDPSYIQSNQAQIAGEMNYLDSTIQAGGNPSMNYFLPYGADSSTIVKVSQLQMDVYMPNTSVDNMSQRPVIVYVHTGNFLPPIINNSVGGSKNDSAAVEFCTQWAKRGYVAVAPNYRHGWNPQANDPQTGQIIRRATLLNAVYRAIHDVKQSVRVLRAGANQGTNPYQINPDKVALFGQGSGGYVVLAYSTIDSQSETATSKFLNPLNNQPYVNPQVVGNYEGFGGLLNLYVDNGESADIQHTVNAGGALGDISWLDGNEAPMMSFHCINDPFAPFDTNQVVVPTNNNNVVPVPGPNTFIPEANSLGLNTDWINKNEFQDPYTSRARSLYGRTFETFYPTAPLDEVTIDADAEGLFAFQLPLKQARFENQGAPWEWWSESDVIALAQAVSQQTGGSYDGAAIHQNALMSNPDMSKEKALRYIDTIQGYMHPRLMLGMGIGDTNAVGYEDLYPFAKAEIKIFPNPSVGEVNIQSRGNAIQMVTVFDLTGKVVYRSENINRQVESINLNELKSGMYLIKVEGDEASSTERLFLH